jgi:hypothetical protein
MNRKHIVTIGAMLATGKKLVSFFFELYDSKKGTYTGGVTTADSIDANGVATNPVKVYLADLTGKPQVFKDVDSIVAQVMGIVPSGATVKVDSVATASFVAAAPTNPVKANQREIGRLTRSIARATLNEGKAATELAQLATFDGGTPAQQALFDEAENKLATITETKAAMAARKAALESFNAANGA